MFAQTKWQVRDQNRSAAFDHRAVCRVLSPTHHFFPHAPQYSAACNWSTIPHELWRLTSLSEQPTNHKWRYWTMSKSPCSTGEHTIFHFSILGSCLLRWHQVSPHWPWNTPAATWLSDQLHTHTHARTHKHTQPNYPIQPKRQQTMKQTGINWHRIERTQTQTGWVKTVVY